MVLAAVLHADGLRDERGAGLDPPRQRKPVACGLAACFAQPDRAGGVRRRDQGGVG